ncbi:MAG: hypothetical protein AAF702_36040 [Chloroflexota bacterium]
MGWAVALIGVVLLMVSPILGIGIFLVGVLIAINVESGNKAPSEFSAASILLALLIGVVVLLFCMAMTAGLLGGLL